MGTMNSKTKNNIIQKLKQKREKRKKKKEETVILDGFVLKRYRILFVRNGKIMF